MSEHRKETVMIWFALVIMTGWVIFGYMTNHAGPAYVHPFR